VETSASGCLDLPLNHLFNGRMSSAHTSETFKAEIERLTTSFRKNLSQLKSEAYDEAALRNDYLVPLWRALGWDVENVQGATQPLREVQIESRVDIAGRKKRADYLFRTDGIDRFVCEAKKPREDLSHRDAYQAQRYAFNLKLLVAALTNFESLKLFVVGGKPDQDAPWEVCKQWQFFEYVDKAQELWNLFARENVATGSLDKFVASLPKRVIKGKARQGWLIVPDRVRTVDAEFLEYIEQQREELARDLVRHNPDVEWSDDLLNECIQRILDRILFVRICEDRDIDTGRSLENLLKEWQAIPAGKPAFYSLLVRHFNSLDESFNGALFSGHESEKLKVSDSYLAHIITDLSSEDSPYLFSTLPVEILGSVYEQFIGKVVCLKGNKVAAELKPELRKAEGVYYTPRFVVNFIVTKTVGRLIQGKSLREVSKLKFIDPSCGSGSFLLRVFELVCEHYLRWLAGHPSQQKAELCYRDDQNSLQLTTHLKREIMRNNVFGVDIDHQAVEVTMLSLYLKILEGETRTSLGKQRTLFPKETFLPDLSSNIKCGNSLIASDFYADEQLSLLEPADTSRVNAFDWPSEFSAVTAGGFDAVVGNPPYVRIQTLKEIHPAEVDYFKRHYLTAARGNYDLYLVFVEKGFSLLNQNGLMGYILPSKFLATDYGVPLRKLLSDKRAVLELVDFRHEQVFDGPTTYTCLLFLSAKPNQTVLYSVASPPASISTDDMKQDSIPASELSSAPWEFGSKEASEIRSKLTRHSVPLLELPTLISRGSSTGDDEVFMLTRKGRSFQTRQGTPVEVEESILRIPLYATDYGRYRFQPAAEERIIFPYTVTGDGYSLLAESVLRSKYPRAYAYLASRRRELKQRKQFSEWYAFSAPRNLDAHDKADLLVPLLADKGLFCKIPKERDTYCLMASGGFSISVAKDSGYAPEYILGLLNSKLIFWVLQKMSNIFRGGWITCTKQYVGKLPLHTVSFSEPNEKQQYDSIVRAVKQILGLHAALTSVKTSRTKTMIQRQIAATETRIDRLVYDLYGLTEQEVELVERAQQKDENEERVAPLEQTALVLED
jgi:Eco57I restriction-modification methylase/TaqI-like C-terminal specificity domain